MEKFGFIKSTRFWALTLIAIVGVLKAENIIDDSVATGLITILGGFTILRTVDRTTDSLSK
jgi:hypothetical protein